MQRLINNHIAVNETDVHCPLPIRTLIDPEVDLALNCPRIFHVTKSISLSVIQQSSLKTYKLIM
jgi:hypothetical protein